MKSTEISWIELLPLLGKHDIIVTANGSSMIPTIVRGDRIHIRKPSAAPDLGELILCRDRDGDVMIHRVVATEPVLRTRGDALSVDDPPVAEVLGTVTRVEKTWRSRLRRLTLKLRG